MALIYYTPRRVHIAHGRVKILDMSNFPRFLTALTLAIGLSACDPVPPACQPMPAPESTGTPNATTEADATAAPKPDMGDEPHDDSSDSDSDTDGVSPMSAECRTQCIEDCYSHAVPGSLLCHGLISDGAIPPEGENRCKFQLCVEVCSWEASMCKGDADAAE